MSNIATENIVASLGGYGGKYISDTSATTPTSKYDFCAILAITDTVVSAVAGNIDIASMAITKGIIVYGRWSSITLTSGSVIAYHVPR